MGRPNWFLVLFRDGELDLVDYRAFKRHVRRGNTVSLETWREINGIPATLTVSRFKEILNKIVRGEMV